MAKKECVDERRDSKVEELLQGVCSKIKSMVDTSVIVGDQIKTEGATIIPLSKVTVGFVAGGGEYDKMPNDTEFPFAGGSGAGFNVQPVGYLLITKDEVSFTKIMPEGPFEKLIEVLPNVVDKVNNTIKSKS